MTDIASGSALDSFLQCRRKHYYAYDLGLEPPDKGRAITVGTAGHLLLGSYYKAVQAGASHSEAVDAATGMASWTLEVQAGIGSAYANYALQLCTLYWAVYASDFRWMQVLAVEQEYRADIDGTPYAATIDLVIRNTQTDQVEVWDHRFLGSFYDEDTAVIDPQMPRYVLLLRQLGLPVTAAVRNQVRTASLKSQDPASRLRRQPVPLSDPRLQAAARDRDQVLMEWRAWRELPLATRGHLARRTFSQSCTYCYFKRPCAMEAAGEDATSVLESDFRPRTYGYREIV